jgi:heme-degrading monooxygenase HmoA
MHARVVTIQFQPGMTDRAIAIFHESVVPAAREQEGFTGGLLLTDRITGKAVAISLWETEADLTAGETGGYYPAQIIRFAGVGIFAGPPVRETYEVSVQV